MKKVLEDFGGKDAIKIANILISTGEEEITDEKISDLSKVKLNVVRRILYILNENKLTVFRRVKDKRSGWYIYYWRHSFDRLAELIRERTEQVIEKLEEKLEYEEENQFFRCENGCKGRYDYITAIGYDFRCPVCQNGKLDAEDNSQVKEMLITTIKNLKMNL